MEFGRAVVRVTAIPEEGYVSQGVARAGGEEVDGGTGARGCRTLMSGHGGNGRGESGVNGEVDGGEEGGLEGEVEEVD